MFVISTQFSKRRYQSTMKTSTSLNSLKNISILKNALINPFCIIAAQIGYSFLYVVETRRETKWAAQTKPEK